MSKTFQINDGLDVVRSGLGKLRLVLGEPPPPADYLSPLELHSMRVNIEKQVEGGHAMVGFFGCREGVGTSTVATEFAWYLAQNLDGKVALLDANLRSNGRGVDTASPGLGDVLAGTESVEDVSTQLESSPLVFIAGGGAGGTEVETSLRPARLESLARELQLLFDVVVVDLPPLNRYPDTLLISPHLSGVVLVLETEADRWEEARGAVDAVESAGGELFGAVLNKKKNYVPEWLYKHL
jgi:protein-tyrosine kinase